MAQPNIDKIEIVEPPIQELSKRHGTFAQGCFMGCLFFILLGIALIFGIKFYLGKSPSRIDRLPESFPASIHLYDKENIESIRLTPGQFRTRSLQLASIMPRLLLSPLVNTAETEQLRSTDRIEQTWKLLTAPVDTDTRDTITVEWKNIGADPRFIYSYYTSELSKAGFTVSPTNDGYGIAFTSSSITGGITITTSKNNKTTEALSLTVSYPEE